MIYKQAFATTGISSIIKSFWMVDSEGDDLIREEKIIPDGYPEIIFHYADPYKIKIDDDWKIQGHNLLAGQLSKFIHLKNTGKTGMFAIKFQPWAIAALFNFKMDKIVDKVISLPKNIQTILAPVSAIAIFKTPFEKKRLMIESFFSDFIEKRPSKKVFVRQATEKIIHSKGNISASEIANLLIINERTLQRNFKNDIGLSVKFYGRIIRLSSLFEKVKSGKINWTQITYISGFYDQSHFIKNFTEFTGEKPSAYGFSDENMANLFL